ncbi:MAG: hypothetical protein V3T14_03435 [Myxococcota bacterium]
MFERRVLPAMVICALLLPGTSPAGSILEFFLDGCAAIDLSPDPVQICEQGTRAGAPCQQDPIFPPFSTDCCRSLSACSFDDPNNRCSDPTAPRSCVSGQTGKSCVTNSGCDSFICLAGDPNTLGEACEADLDCEDPAMFFDGDCGSAVDGVCGEPRDINLASSNIGNVLRINDETLLLAVVTGQTIVPQPQWRRDKRRQLNLEFQLVDEEDVIFTDGEFCALAQRLGQKIVPTRAILTRDTED